jgi:putative transposase
MKMTTETNNSLNGTQQAPDSRTTSEAQATMTTHRWMEERQSELHWSQTAPPTQVADTYDISVLRCDMHLTSSQDPKMVIGQPTIYIVSDRNSQMIVSWSFDMERPNYKSLADAIAFIADDKRPILNSLGLIYDPSDWVADDIAPHRFMCDLTGGLECTQRIHGVAVEGTLWSVPGLRPNRTFLYHFPFTATHSAVHAKYPVPQGPKSIFPLYRQQPNTALLSHKEFEGILVRAILEHNRSPLPNCWLSPEQREAGVLPIPRELYRHGLSVRETAPYTMFAQDALEEFESLKRRKDNC